jgi:flagellar FliL protein
MRLGRIILIVILLLIAGGAAGGFYFQDRIKQALGLDAGRPLDVGPPPKKIVKPEDVAYCDLPEIMVTLDSRGSTGGHILKLSASLALDDKTDQPRVQAYIPRVIDVFQTYIRQMTVEDVTGVPKIQLLRQELLTRINTALEPAHVDDVLFRQVLVQ